MRRNINFTNNILPLIIFFPLIPLSVWDGLDGEISPFFFLFLVILLGTLLCWSRRPFLRKYVLLSIVALLIALSLSYRTVHTVSPPSDIGNLTSSPPSLLSGDIVSEPHRGERYMRYVVLVHSINGVVREEPFRVLLTGDVYPRCIYGDTIRARATIKAPEQFLNEYTKRNVPYPSILRKDSIHAQAPYSTILSCERSLTLSLHQRMVKFLIGKKSAFIQTVREHIHEPEASLATGIVIGGRSVLPEKTQEVLTDTGIIHIAVLSGYNITVVSEAVLAFASRFSVTFAPLATIISIIVFVITAGAHPPLVRAALMGVIVAIARMTGRSYQAMRALVAASLIMIFFNPSILFYDASFHLSFFASVGIIYFTPPFLLILRFLRSRILKEIIGATLASQVAVFPYLLYQFGEVSLVAPLTNSIVIPFIPLLMLVTMLGGVLTPFSPLGVPFLFASELLSSYILTVAERIATFPFASADLSVSLVSMCLLYILLVIAFNKFFKGVPQNAQRYDSN